MEIESKLNSRLENLATKKSKPFCYSCYQVAPSGRCTLCGSDDLMRELAGEGVEWGLDWIIRSLIRDNLTPINAEETFEESVSSCYPDTVQVGWMTFDTIRVMKELDLIGWQIAQSDWVSSEVSDGIIMSFDNESTYYRTSDVERYLDAQE